MIVASGVLLAEEQAGLLGQYTTSESTGKAGITSLEVVRRSARTKNLCIAGYNWIWDGIGRYWMV